MNLETFIKESIDGLKIISVILSFVILSPFILIGFVLVQLLKLLERLIK